MLRQVGNPLLFGDSFSLELTGFEPLAEVTLLAHCTEDGRHFETQRRVATNAQGQCIIGDAEMILYELAPVVFGHRYNVSDVSKAAQFDFKVCDAQLTAHCSLTVERYFLAPGFERHEINGENGVFATLFLPSGDEIYHNLVVEIGGSAGGLLEWRSASLCSKLVCPALCLAWFRYKSLRGTMDIEIEYIDKAIAIGLRNARISSNARVSLYSISKGTELAFIYAAAYPDRISSIVSVSGSSVVTDPSFFLKGERIAPAALLDFGLAYTDKDNALNLFPAFSLGATSSDCTLPVEQLSPGTRVLFICGTDDQNLPAVTNAHFLNYSKMPIHVSVTIKVYQGGGHLLEPPSPHCSHCYQKMLGCVVAFGGTDIKMHALARRDAWNDVVKFLGHSSGPNAPPQTFAKL